MWICVKTFAALFLAECLKHKERVSVCACRSSEHYRIILSDSEGPLTRGGDWLLVKDEKQCHTCVQSYNTAT